MNKDPGLQTRGETLEYAGAARGGRLSGMAVGAVCASSLGIGLIGFGAFVHGDVRWSITLSLMFLGSISGVAGILLGLMGCRHTPSTAKGGESILLLSIILGLVAVVVGLSLGGVTYTDHRRNLGYTAGFRCSNNLRNIGLAIQMYGEANDRRLPGSFTELMTTMDLPAELFVCWSSGAVRASGETIEEIAGKLDDPRHCSYVYWGAGLELDEVTGDVVLAHERAVYHGGGINVLIGDGSVRFVDAEAADYMVRELELGRNPPRGWE